MGWRRRLTVGTRNPPHGCRGDRRFPATAGPAPRHAHQHQTPRARQPRRRGDRAVDDPRTRRRRPRAAHRRGCTWLWRSTAVATRFPRTRSRCSPSSRATGWREPPYGTLMLIGLLVVAGALVAGLVLLWRRLGRSRLCSCRRYAPHSGASWELGVNLAAAARRSTARQGSAAVEPAAEVAHLVGRRLDRADRRTGAARRASSDGVCPAPAGWEQRGLQGSRRLTGASAALVIGRGRPAGDGTGARRGAELHPQSSEDPISRSAGMSSRATRPSRGAIGSRARLRFCEGPWMRKCAYSAHVSASDAFYSVP